MVGSASPAPHPHLGAVASSRLQEDLVLVPGGLWALGQGQVGERAEVSSRVPTQGPPSPARGHQTSAEGRPG